MVSIVDNFKLQFKNGDVLTRLLFVNVTVFILIWILLLLYPLLTGAESGSGVTLIYDWLALRTNNLAHLLFKPYTFVTHLFVHDFKNPTHLIFNMITLYFMGKIFLNYYSSKHLLGLYFTGGIVGALGLVLITFLSPFFQGSGHAFGASAAIMSIAIAACAHSPNTKVHLFGVLPVKLMWVGVAFVLSDLFYFYDENTGGHLAHLLGAATGYQFIINLKKGRDITYAANKVINGIVNLFKAKQKLKVEYSTKEYKQMSDEDYNYTVKVTQEEIDAILDKISSSGYDSLSKKEKEILFKHSRRN